MADNIPKLNIELKRPIAGELAKRIHELVMEYDGEVGLSEAIGAIELVKFTLMSKQLFEVE